jgi:8-oxo-dGTP pyrophosphatase MutT (NUDIX family)
MQVDGVLGYLAKITRFDRSAFTPLFIAGQHMGCVNQVWLARLLESEADLFGLQPEGLVCKVAGDYAAISIQLNQAARRWQAAGWLNGWRNENFSAFLPDSTPLFELGLTSRAVHLNGLTRTAAGEVKMWVGRRSPDKAVDPNRMDNLMGGGIAAGESIELALEREGWEEAGIPADRLELLPQTGLLLAERPVQRGLHREWLHVYDLWLSGSEQPCNQDGEVAEHVCLSLAEVEDLLVAERFMIDAALVAIDCLLRLGYWAGRESEIAAAMAAVRFPLNHSIHVQS